MMTKYTYTAQNAVRLDEFLREALSESVGKKISNSKIRRLIISGSVSVGFRRVRVPAFALRPGSGVSAEIDEEKLFREKGTDDIAFDLSEQDVLFEDDDIIVVNKPALFPTERTSVESRDNLHAALVRYLHAKSPSARNPPYAGIMHRLDRETSGVILFTKTRAANKGCHDMFESRTAKKTYIALCTEKAGKAERTFSVSMKMGRISRRSEAAKWGECADGLPSRTDFRIIGRGKRGGRLVALVECAPLTGRTHQIRVHLASAGLPIVGDTLYGGEKASRIHLHALSLEFPHPISGEIVRVEAECPFGINSH